MTATTKVAAVVQAGGGRMNTIGALVKVPAEAFEGRLFVFEGVLAAGAFIPQHTHALEDEVSVVLSGELTIDLGGVVSTTTAGAVVLKPRGVHHAMWNHTQSPTRVLEIHTPGQLEPYYDELGRLFQEAESDTAEHARRITDLHAQYGITYHPELISEVRTPDGRTPGAQPK